MDVPAPPVLQPGSRVGAYELVRWLGEGGFAEVWLGRRVDAPAEAPVAVKVVRRSRARDARAQVMFLDEASLAARIRHPNVATVHGTGAEGGVLYLLMEHVAGGSLDAVIRGAEAAGEPIPIPVAARLVADVCAGLHAAHELAIDGRPQDVIHRDVSPHNILITESGVPKLIDFGIAKTRERLAAETSTGIAKGKIAYMSPEQARAEPLDRRSDLWSIGAVAYELLEGHPLLQGATEVARLQALVNGAARPRFSRTPARVAAVLARALSFAPGERQATADELRLDLERALAREGLEASAADVAAACARARAHAEAAVEPSRPRLAALLAAPTAAVTVSAPVPVASARAAWPSRRRWAGALALAVLAPLVVVAAVMRPAAPRPAVTPALSATPAAPPPAALPASPPPEPPAPALRDGSLAEAPAPAPPVVHPRANRSRAAAPDGRAPFKPKDDDQIE
jgi:serine/threonine-protein kinase